MVIQLGVGPSCLRLRPSASPPADGARRLVDPAGCRPSSRQAGPIALGSYWGLVTVASPLVTRALSW